MKDVFLLAKLILSIGVATILSDPSAYPFATIVSFLLKCILGFNCITEELIPAKKKVIRQD